jgi:hypothetical protein
MIDRSTTQPASYLMEFILGLLAPMLMAGSITDLHLGRLAAQEAIDTYKTRGQTNLMAIGQILAFALTALDNLRLSMAPDLSLSMKLKLRGSANALNRSARDDTQTPDKGRRTTPPLKPEIAEQAAMATWEETETAPGSAAANVVTVAAPAVQPVASPAVPLTAEQPNGPHWANAMRMQAARLRANTPNVPPFLQKNNALWVDVLTGVASDLTRGKCAIASPGMSKAELLRTTLMSSDPGFPAHLGTGIKRPAAAFVKGKHQAAKRT